MEAFALYLYLRYICAFVLESRNLHPPGENPTAPAVALPGKLRPDERQVLGDATDIGLLKW
jgi:hypothetical protein